MITVYLFLSKVRRAVASNKLLFFVYFLEQIGNGFLYHSQKCYHAKKIKEIQNIWLKQKIKDSNPKFESKCQNETTKNKF